MKHKLVTLLMSLLLISMQGAAQNSNADENKIKAKVRSYFNANKNVLLGTAVEAAFEQDADVDDMKVKGKSELDRNKKVRDDLKSQGVEYEKGQIVNVEYFDFTSNETSARIFATARYKLSFKAGPGAPEYTEYDELREFSFVKNKNKWEMQSQKLYPLGLKLNITPDDSLSVNDIPKMTDKPANASGKDPAPASGDGNAPAPEDKGPSAGDMAINTVQVPTGTYNKTAAANYALKYAMTGNTASYRTYGNDCTNFISQCLAAGGWTGTGSALSRTSNTTWFYSSLGESFTTYTWAGAHNHYFFHKETARSTAGAYVSSLRLGDIMQVSFSNDGHIGHTVIVSKEDTNGTDYVSYHTTNTLNKPVTQFVSDCGATAAFYVWLVKATF